ncbi:MAG: HK97 family phage prohead protease [Alistipes sp.]|nr:HK97 family phage prohead protease [Alistipes sp.]
MNNQKDIERRNYAFPVTVTGEDEKRTVEGYALLFDTASDGLSFVEIIERGALDGVIEKSNVFALLNHDADRGILARSKNGVGSLSLEVDDKGLKYRFEAPKTALGDELLEYLRRGEISESSFAFTVESETWKIKEDDTWERTIHKIKRLYDVSPVFDAAYSATSVNLRGKEQVESEMLAARNRAEAHKDEMNKYYSNLTVY